MNFKSRHYELHAPHRCFRSHTIRTNGTSHCSFLKFKERRLVRSFFLSPNLLRTRITPKFFPIPKEVSEASEETDITAMKCSLDARKLGHILRNLTTPAATHIVSGHISRARDVAKVLGEQAQWRQELRRHDHYSNICRQQRMSSSSSATAGPLGALSARKSLHAKL